MPWFSRLLLAGLLAMPPAAIAATPLPVPRGEHRLEPFGYRGVTLEPGPLREQVDEVTRAYLGFPDDDYLIGFRRRAGREAPGRELGGWYSIDRFIPFGQVLSGLARMYAGTGDASCREKLERLVSGWAECIEPDGYFFYSRRPNATHYGYEKMVCGLVDAYVFAGNRDALTHLSRITDWAERSLDRSRPYAYNGPGDPGEWYTLSENLHRAYLATGESRYREFARVWEYTGFWEHIRTGTDFHGRAPRHHAYSHINSLSGAAVAYRITGSGEYLETLVRGYDYLQQQQVYATGGYGPGEKLLPTRALLEALDNHPRADHFETQCASWAAFKLAKALISFTGEARYGDWVERLIINGTGASLPVSPKGEVTYYAHYSLSGGAKDYSTGPWTCCSGTRIQAVADYHDLVYFKGGNALCVNLFTPSTCEWTVGGTRVAVRQRTTLPEGNMAELEIGPAQPVAFALKLRRPAWLVAPARIAVNGKVTPAEVDALGWFTFQRTWRAGDQVTIELPMALRTEPFPPRSPARFPVALVHGPTVLAMEGSTLNPVATIDWDHLAGSFTPVPERALTYRLRGDAGLRLRPFRSFAQGEPYYIYFDPAKPWSRMPVADVRFSGSWQTTSAGLRVSQQPGASLEFSFRGAGVRWIARKFDDAGMVEVLVDGRSTGIIDLHDVARNVPFQHDQLNLPPGPHTIRLVAHAKTNPKSRGRFINFERFDVLAAEGTAPRAAP